jgi:hypothetical protein
VPLIDVVRSSFATLTVNQTQASHIRTGRRLVGVALPNRTTALLDQTGSFLALYSQEGPDAVAEAVLVWPVLFSRRRRRSWKRLGNVQWEACLPWAGNARVRVCRIHVNDDGHHAVRIDRHKWHCGLIVGHTLFVRYKIEPDLGGGADIRDRIAWWLGWWAWEGLAVEVHVVVVMHAAHRAVHDFHALTDVKMRAQRTNRLREINSAHINSGHPDAELRHWLPSAVRCLVDCDVRVGVVQRHAVRLQYARVLDNSEDAQSARELRSAQNQRAACNAAERGLSNTLQSVPRESDCMRVPRDCYTACLSPHAVCP